MQNKKVNQDRNKKTRHKRNRKNDNERKWNRGGISIYSLLY